MYEEYDEKTFNQLNTLARKFYEMSGCEVEEGYDFSEATHPAEEGMWNLAEVSYDFWHNIFTKDGKDSKLTPKPPKMDSTIHMRDNGRY